MSKDYVRVYVTVSSGRVINRVPKIAFKLITYLFPNEIIEDTRAKVHDLELDGA